MSPARNLTLAVAAQSPHPGLADSRVESYVHLGEGSVSDGDMFRLGGRQRSSGEIYGVKFVGTRRKLLPEVAAAVAGRFTDGRTKGVHNSDAGRQRNLAAGRRFDRLLSPCGDAGMAAET
jgi:hypothetical protein